MCKEQCNEDLFGIKENKIEELMPVPKKNECWALKEENHECHRFGNFEIGALGFNECDIFHCGNFGGKRREKIENIPST